MKAQSLRKTLWLTSGLFALAIVGGGAYYLTQVRPAEASAPDDAWIKKSWDAYLKDKADAKPTTIWPVSFEQLQGHITRPDLMSKESRIGVWPYVGPVPPPPREEAKEAPKADQPKGLAAIGAPSMILRQQPPDKSMVKWVFPGGKKPGYFVTGDFIKETKDAKGRFKLKGVERPDPDSSRFKLVYDVYDDETKDPILVDQVAEFTLIKDDAKPIFSEKPRETKPAAPVKPSPAGTTGVVPGEPAPAKPALVSADRVKIDVKNNGDNARAIEFDQDASDYIRANPDAIIAEVKTEEVKGGGIRIAGMTTGGVAAKFGIQQGDIIKSINGKPVHNRAQAVEVVKALPKDIASVVVVIQRNARDIVYDVDPRDPATRAAAAKARFDQKK